MTANGSRTRVIAALASLSLLQAGPAAAGGDWPQWRGPARDGVAPGFVAPATWPDKLAKVWSQTVGEGHSNPVVKGDKVFIHSRQADNEVVQALRLSDGGTIWSTSWPVPYEMHPAAKGHGKGPKSTPALDGASLFTLGISGALVSLDANTGKILWRREFGSEFKQTAPEFGTATSPLVEQGMVVAFVGGLHDGSLSAFDAKTGETRWSLKGEGPGYASPILAEIGGKKQFVTQSDSSIIGVEAATGKLLWKLPLKTAYNENVVTPLMAGDLMIVSAVEYGLRAFRFETQGGVITPKEVWNKPESSLYMSSPVLAGGRLFGFSDRKSGHLFALDPKTGDIIWAGDGRLGENAALISAGDVVLALIDSSELLVLKAGAGAFTPLARYTMADSPTWAHPVPVGDGILIKDRTNLSLWTWRPQKPGNTASPSSY